MLNNASKLTVLGFFVLLQIATARVIYGLTDVFYTQLCDLGYVVPGIHTITCTTNEPQKGIISTGVSYAEYTRPANSMFRQQLSASYTVDPTSSFTIHVNYQNPAGGMPIRVFLIVIKQQPTVKFIDLINFSWMSDPLIFNTDNTVRTVSKTIDVRTASIFSGGTTGLISIPFASFSSNVAPLGNGDPLVNLQYQIFTSLTNPNLKVELRVQPGNKVQKFGGFALLFNQGQIPLQAAKGFNIAFTKVPYYLGGTTRNLDLVSVADDYGPAFQGKCFLGIHRFKYQGQFGFSYIFGWNPASNYEVYKEVTNSLAQQWGHLFCFGNNSACPDDSTHQDLIDGSSCYTASTCPLPVFTGWTVPGICPSCVQLACQTCKVTDRSSCTLCKAGTNTHLSGSICVCDTNFIPVTQAIDTAALGLWNNLTPSLKSCKLNCSAVITGCLQNDCTNSTYCTVCNTVTNYVLVTVSPTQQTCKLCGSQISDCAKCTDQKFCATCSVGFYLKPVLLSGAIVGKICEMCSIPISNCVKCSDSVTCTECDLGYNLNSSTHKCDCDVSFNSLQHCKTCIIPTQCSQCSSTEFYLNSTTSLCQFCHEIHAECSRCSDEKTCTTCSTTFIPDPVTLVAQGITPCAPCRQFIPDCTECSSTQVCTNCDLLYGLNSENKCIKCDLLLMPGCEQCQSAVACLKCDQSTRLLLGACHYCHEIDRCIDCIVNGVPELECTVCKVGYYLSTNGHYLSLGISKKQCKCCQNVISYCKTCSDATTCTSCTYPYLLGPTGLCDQCERKHEFYGGVCMKIAGCLQTVLRNGKQICIACATHLHYFLDQATMTCKCAYGYEEFHEVNKLMKCYARCGDGILVTGQEQCDDGGLIKLDGCSDLCQVESSFQCTAQSPSKCILIHEIQGFKYNHALRIMPQNKAKLSFSIEPSIEAFKVMDFSKLMKLEFGSRTSVKQEELRFRYLYESKELLVQFPYYEELQSTLLSCTLEVDAEMIVSSKRFFFLATLLNGKNAPLILQSQETIETHADISTISLILTILLLLQFFLGSYSHKMIGLETIQTVQLFYFTRMIASSSSTSLLQAMNSISYSAAGYNNARVFFGEHQLEILKSQTHLQVQKQFLSVHLHKYFLTNANFFLLLVPCVALAFAVRLKQKIAKRQLYLQNKKRKQLIAEYTDLKRSSEWIYDHLVFPLVIMFNMISFFNVIISTSSHHPVLLLQGQQFGSIETASFVSHLLLLFSTISIYCSEIFRSYEGFIQRRMSEEQRQNRPQTQVENLQNDNNSPDRPNFHPLYVLVYLFYYLVTQIVLVFGTLFGSFKYGLQLLLSVSVIYLIVILVWKPYHPIVSKHNYFLYLNHGSVAVFLAICLVFAYDPNIPQTTCVYLMYFVMVLLSLIVMGGFVRIFIEKSFRKNLERDPTLLEVEHKKLDSKDVPKVQQTPFAKKRGLLANNQYVFENQMKGLSIKYGLKTEIKDEFEEQPMVASKKSAFSKKQTPPISPHFDEIDLTKKERQVIIEKVRQQYRELLDQHNENFPFPVIQNPALENEQQLSPSPDAHAPQTTFDHPAERVLQVKPQEYMNSSGVGSEYDKFKEREEKRLMQRLMDEDQQRLLKIKEKLRREFRTLFL